MNELIPVSDLKEMATALSYGNLFGKTKEQIFPLLLIAQAEGKHPAIAVQEYDIIKGKPALTSRATLSRFQASGGKIQYIKRDEKECNINFYHPSGGELTVIWTMARAKTSGLGTSDVWKKYPAQMLSARCIAEGVRALYPACLNSLYTVEERQDIPDRRPAKPVDTTPHWKPEPVDVTPVIIPELIKLEKLVSTLSGDLKTRTEKAIEYIKENGFKNPAVIKSYNELIARIETWATPPNPMPKEELTLETEQKESSVKPEDDELEIF